MQFLGHSIEVWGVVILATFTKLRSTNNLSILGAIGISLVSVASAILFYHPVMVLFGLSTSWELIIAGLIALTSEDIMQSIVKMSKDSNFIKEIIKLIIAKK